MELKEKSLKSIVFTSSLVIPISAVESMISNIKNGRKLAYKDDTKGVPDSGVAKPGPTRALARAMFGRARANIFIILNI